MGDDDVKNPEFRQGVWSHIDERIWNSWQWQMKNCISDLGRLRELINLTKEEEAGCKLVSKKLNFKITPYYFNLIDHNDSFCPIRKQVIPRVEETIVFPEEMLDPLGEEKNEMVSGVIHRYPDRVLLLATNTCASYCRYCTRSRLVSNAQGYGFRPDFDQAINYIQKHTEIRDVLISGGDPLLLSDQKIDYLIRRIRMISHVEMVRIGSRVPVFLPQRITTELCGIFRKYGPIWMSVHVNHPKECTAELKDACDKLLCSKVVLGNQSVLLKGINDEVSIMMRLCHQLMQMGVRPYYLYLCDLIVGSNHFRVELNKGVEIIKSMRGYTSGYAIPQLVIDLPGGGGKVPINPNYIQRMTPDGVFLRNYKGDEYYYPFSEFTDK